MHQAFELAAGSGVIGQRHIGLTPAAAVAASTDVAWVAAAVADDRRWGRMLAVGAGAALAAPVLHYTLFPWRVRRGLPVLVEAEGLRGQPLVAYVVLLYIWGVSGAIASAAIPSGQRRWILLGLAGAVAFRQLAAAHVAWIREESDRNPRWWNRAGTRLSRDVCFRFMLSPGLLTSSQPTSFSRASAPS
ncbi:MAG: hypothetical protein AB1679_11195 [Actinomycetota bacterium]